MFNNIENPIYILIGKTCTGKSTLEKRLEKENGFNRAISFTTRDKREGEVDGVDYFYITDEEFDEKFSDGFIYERTEYVVNGKTIKYGLGEGSIKSNDKPCVVVVNPDGSLQILSIPSIMERAVVVHLKEELLIRVERYLKREKDTLINASDYIRLTDRLIQDEKDFEKYYDKKCPLEEVKKFCRNNNIPFLESKDGNFKYINQTDILNESEVFDN